MKKWFMIGILFLINSWGFAQSQDSVASVTITIQPPQDAVWNDIYCYCVEYIEAANENKKDASWKCIYVVPEINKKNSYTETSCVLSGLMTKKFYIFRVYAFYCGYGYCGYGEYGTLVPFRTPQRGNDFVTIDCGPLNIGKVKAGG